MRGATRLWVEKCQSCLISIHTPHAGSDRTVGGMSRTYAGFQSTLPMRGATIILIDGAEKLSISIHTPHAGSDIWLGCTITQIQISIHTPHAGSDWCKGAGTGGKDNFNPHSPCGERHHVREKLFYSLSFQSTLPMRGATPITGISCTFCQRISIHTPHAGSDGACIPIAAWWHISIHTPHAGSDDD